MNTWLKYLLGIAVSYTSIVSAVESIGSRNPNYTRNTVAEQEYEGPFLFTAHTDVVGKAKFEHRRCRPHLDNIQYAEADVDASLVVYYQRCIKEAAFATLAYSFNRIDWKNPYYSQKDFNTVSPGIAFVTERFCDWFWAAAFRVNFDINHFKFPDYLTYDILFAGRYSYREDLGLHMGLLVLTGMKIDRVYPIVGFDWKISDRWKLKLVFPTDMALIYSFTKEWSVAVAASAFDTRHRVGPDANLSRAVTEYRSAGIEGGINYRSCDGQWKFNIHAGEIIGGRVRVANRHYHHIKRFRFNSAPYVGGNLEVKF